MIAPQFKGLIFRGSNVPDNIFCTIIRWILKTLKPVHIFYYYIAAEALIYQNICVTWPKTGPLVPVGRFYNLSNFIIFLPPVIFLLFQRLGVCEMDFMAVIELVFCCGLFAISHYILHFFSMFNPFNTL